MSGRSVNINQVYFQTDFEFQEFGTLSFADGMAVRSMTTDNENHWVKSVWPSDRFLIISVDVSNSWSRTARQNKNTRDGERIGLCEHGRIFEMRWVGFDETV